MRVLLVAHQYWPTPGSGTQVLLALVRDLTGRGHSVDVLTCSPPSGIEKIGTGPHGERIHFVAGPERAGLGLGRILRLAAFAWGVLRHGRRVEANVVVSDPPPTAGLAALFVARRAKVPLVYYMADSWVGVSSEKGGLAGALRGVIRLFEGTVIRGADAVVAATRGMGRIADSLGGKRTTVVENGADLSVYSPEGETWTPGTGRPFFLYAGNAGAVHGAGVFTEAANVLWREGLEFDVVFMGYGADFESQLEVASHPERVHLVGPQPASTVAAAYRGAVGALSSLRPNPKYADARPIKTLTGLSAGCPAVYAGEGDFADVLKAAELGWVTAWDVSEVTGSMREALRVSEAGSASALRARCAAYAAEHFDDRASAGRVGDVIERTASASTQS